MLDILKGPSDAVGFVVEKDNDWIQSVYLVSLDELPPKYLPDPDAFHDESLRPNWSVAEPSFLLGKKWDAKLLATIERRYLDAYGFSFFTEPKKGRAMPAGVLSFVFDGGFPLMHTFNHIRTAVPFEARAHSDGVSVNSPGILSISAPASPADHLMKVLTAVPGSTQAYDALHQWARLPWQKVSKVPATAEDDIKRLAGRLLVDPSVLLPGDGIRSDQALLVAGKILASYYRRLWTLLDFGEEVEFLDAARIQRQADERPYEEEDDQFG
ncbi:MAG TPA: hypothetical protein VFG23_14575 [Polyangia bacterium]|nr:hypothetical protein [Polyangia bacterium]